MSLTAAQKGGAPLVQPAASSNQSASTSLKAMASAFGATENEERASGRAACKFWRSEEGCKRGASCTYVHDTSDMKNRCFGCGGNHMKRECPHQPKTGKPDPKKVSKVKATKEGEKGETVEKQPAKEEPSRGHRRLRPRPPQEWQKHLTNHWVGNPRRSCCLRQHPCSRHFGA